MIVIPDETNHPLQGTRPWKAKQEEFYQKRHVDTTDITKGNFHMQDRTGGEGGIDRPGLAPTLLPVEFCRCAALDSKT